MLRYVARRPAEEGPPEKRARPDEPPALPIWYARAIATLLSFQTGAERTGRDFIETCIKQATEVEELDILARFAEDFKAGSIVEKTMPTQEAIAPVENKIPKTILAAVHKRHLELECLPAAVAPHLLQPLCEAFGTHEDNFHKLQCTKDGKFKLIDITMLTTGQNDNQAGEQLRRALRNYPELEAKCEKVKFPGVGQRATLAGDIYVCVELIMVLLALRCQIAKLQ